MQAARGASLTGPVAAEKQPQQGKSDVPAGLAVGMPRRRIGALLAVAVAVLGLDIASKALVVATLSGHQPIRLIDGFLKLRVDRNPGAAFSFAPGLTIVFSLIAIIVVVVILRSSRRIRSVPWAVTLGLLLGGATGNLVDRIFRAPGLFSGWVGVFAAELYGLAALATGVHDRDDAVTRFVAVRLPGQLPDPSGADKTSVVAFLMDDHPGALMDILGQFAIRGVNLTRIESRPTGDGIGRYCFFIDCEGHVAHARVGEALMGLRRVCSAVRFLGSYPQADLSTDASAAGPLAGAGPAARQEDKSDAEFIHAAEWLARIRSGLT